jgi:hypothetical protein
MQKVVGSSPIIRSPEPAGNGGFFDGLSRCCCTRAGDRVVDPLLDGVTVRRMQTPREPRATIALL